jgi:hypothetical protein|tara:strand:- start:9408 stop:9650 length:243 start_codon:yes stop_codon:yes gene_type:complete
MKLPKKYEIKDWKSKQEIVRNITDTLCRLKPYQYPNITSQIENDNSKVELIDTIILNLYSSMGVYDIQEAINSIEVTLND